MDVDGVRFLVQLRKLAIRTVRTSTRSVRNHPFLVGAFLFVIFLYRSSPFLFSLLVSASPVLVCTAVLLGTLLSFGQPQIPEIERDEKISCEISSLRADSTPNSTTVFQKEAVVFDRDDISADKDVEDSGYMGDVCSDSRFGEGLLAPQNSREIVFEQNSSVVEANEEYTSREVEFTKGNDEERLAFEDAVSDYEVHGKGFENEGSVDGHMDDHFEAENHEGTLTFEGAPSDNDVQEKGFENDGSGEGSDDGQVDDRGESSLVPWTRVNGDYGDGDDDDDDYEPSDSGSDGAESSSPDPSMADIIPLLDELHPLIECENLNSGLLGNRSHSSHVSSGNSDEETDHKEGEEVAGDDDDDDDDDEGENQADNEDAEKPSITWTEDDQKNLMELGSSELERNLRLESLIARRRSRRSMKMTTERNLIDLEDFDLPFQVAPISTTRQNPFDFPNDTFDDMGLPPIPGSAPSRLMPRRNPFDLPYDSGEEKPDLMGDSFQQEFTQLNQKDNVFRRHESFHIGSSSSFEFPRHDARDYNHRASRFRPYFIQERLASEASSYSSFMRQSSGISESSSFQRQISELSGSSSLHRQTSGISEASSFQRQSSDVSESKASSASETEPVSAEVDQEETKLGDHDSTEERVPDTEIDHASEHVEHGSQSSDQLEKRDLDVIIPEIRLGEFHQTEQQHSGEINFGSSGNDRDVDSWVSEARDLAVSAGNIEGEMHLTASPLEDKHYSSSSSSLSSEEHNDVKEADEGIVKEEEIGYHLVEKPGVQAENLFEEPDFHNHHSTYTHSAERSPFETNLTLETIQEEHIISSCSSLSSEEHNITEGLKLNADNNTDFPTEQAPDASNFCFNTDVEETHPKDPVYDLSPQVSMINFSISCEELVDLESKDIKQERDGLLLKDDGEADARVHQEDPIISVKEERVADAEAEAEAEHSSSSVEADLFNTVNDITEEPILGNEDALLSDETSVYPANLVDVPGNYEEKLISVAEEGESLTDHCLIHPSPSDYEEEPVVIPEKLEEVGSANTLHSDVYSEMNDLLNLPSQTVGTCTGAQELRQEPIANFFDFREPVESSTGFEFESTILGDFDGKSQLSGSSVPENFMTDHIKELEEALLSELDAVGDFRVTKQGTDLTHGIVGAEEASGVPIPEAISIVNTELETAKVEAVTDELPDENIEQSSDKNDEKPDTGALFFSTFESKVEDAETCIAEFPESHMLENRSAFYVPEPESSQNNENSGDENAEISGSIESIHLQDELLVGGTEVVNRSAPTMEEEIERSAFAAIDVSSESHFSESNTVIEEEVAVDTNESAPAMEEEIERSVGATIDVLEEDEPDAEMKEFAPAEEEEIGRSVVESIEMISGSHVSESNTVTEEDESAAELNESTPVEEEIERSGIEAIDVPSDSLASDRNTMIEEDESAAAMNESALAMEEEIKRSTVEGIDVLSDSLVSERNTVIEEDKPDAELNESAPAVEEEIERSSVEAIGVLSESHALIEGDEAAPSVEEEIISSAVEAIDVLSKSHVSESNTVTEEEDEPAAELNEYAPSLEEEIERSAVDVGEEMERSDVEAIGVLSDSHVSESNTVIEEDERAAELNKSAPYVEEEIERSAVEAIGVVSGSHVSENNTVIEEDEPAAEMSESAPAIEEEIISSAVGAIDVLSDSRVSESNTVIEEDETAPAVEEEIEMSVVDAIHLPPSDSHASESDTLTEVVKSAAPSMEEDIEGPGIDVSSDFHVSNSDTVIEKDEPAIGDKSKDAPEIENHQAESLPDVTVARFEPEQPTSAHVSSSLNLESAESQASQKEDHQMPEKEE